MRVPFLGIYKALRTLAGPLGDASLGVEEMKETSNWGKEGVSRGQDDRTGALMGQTRDLNPTLQAPPPINPTHFP